MNANTGVRADGSAGRLGWASPALARGLGGFTLVAVAVGGALTLFTHDPRVSFDGVLLAIVVVVGGVGFVVARRQPANPIGWLLLAASGSFALYAVAVLYTVLDYREHGGGLPLGRAALAAEPCWILGVVLLGLTVALFPTGRIASSRWRLPLYAYTAAGIWFFTVWAVSQATLRIGQHFEVDEVGNYIGSQQGFTGHAAAAAWLAGPVLLVLWIAFVARQAATWRSAIGERRKQLTWLMSGGTVSLASILVVVNTNTSSNERVVTDVVSLGLAAVPLAIGVGILKYRLYEIDRLISRALSYLIITGVLAGIFIGIVVFATRVLPFSSPVGVAASTLAAATLFNPLRKRIQHLVDRRFNRARYDAETTITVFRTRLREAVDLDTVQRELLHAVEGAVQPAHTALWTRAPTHDPSQ